jgi:glycerol kinase
VVNETTALGAAYLAGLAIGFWKDRNDIKDNWQTDRTFQVNMSREEADRLYEGWKMAVKAAMAFKPEY